MRTFALSLAISLGFLLVSIESIRRHRIKEHAAVLWLGVSAAMVLLSLALPLHALDRLSRLVGVKVPSNLVLLLAVLFLVILVLQLSIGVARLTERTTVLAQEIGILTAREPQRSSGRAEQDGVRTAEDEGNDPRSQ